MSSSRIQAAAGGFFSEIGRFDAPMGELYRRAFVAHLAGLTLDDIPADVRPAWSELLKDHLNVQPGDRAAGEAAAAALPDWPYDRLDSFINALGEFLSLAAPPIGFPGHQP